MSLKVLEHFVSGSAWIQHSINRKCDKNMPWNARNRSVAMAEVFLSEFNHLRLYTEEFSGQTSQ
jgi:hypothetical protein